MKWFRRKHVHEWPDPLVVALLRDHAIQTGKAMTIRCKTCGKEQQIV